MFERPRMRPHFGDNQHCPEVACVPTGLSPQEFGIPDTELEFYEIAAATLNAARGEGHVTVNFTIEETDGSPLPEGYLHVTIDGECRQDAKWILEFLEEVDKEQARRAPQDPNCE